MPSSPLKGDIFEITLQSLKAVRKLSVFFCFQIALSFVCSAEFEALAEQYEELRKQNVEVITVSTDVRFAYLA